MPSDSPLARQGGEPGCPAPAVPHRGVSLSPSHLPTCLPTIPSSSSFCFALCRHTVVLLLFLTWLWHCSGVCRQGSSPQWLPLSLWHKSCGSPAAAAWALGAAGEQWLVVQDLSVAPFSLSPLLLPSPLPLARGVFTPWAYSLLQPEALLSSPVPICSSWLLLPKPEEEMGVSRGRERASRARASNASTVPRMGSYWDEPVFAPQLLQHQPPPGASGEGVRAHSGQGRMIYP